MSGLLQVACAVETPEGVSLELRVAGPFVRACAWALDLSIRLAIYAAASILLVAGQAGLGLWMLVLFSGEWLYPVAFEVLNHGRTPGKASMDLAVVRDDGTPVRLPESIVRSFLQVVDFLPGLYLTGLISMLLRRDFKRLGDLAAGTIVVHRAPGTRPLPLPAVDPAPPPVPLEIEEQRAVIGFARRHAELTPERAEELARLAAPLVGDRPDAVAALLSQAAWLSGRRR